MRPVIKSTLRRHLHLATHLAVPLALLVFAGCGRDAFDGARADSVLDGPRGLVSQSPMVNTEPPFAIFTGRLGESGWTFLARTDGDAEVQGRPPSFVTGTAETLAVPGTRVLYARHWLHASQSYLVVGALQVDDTFRLYRYHDGSGDGWPDASTETLLIDTSPSPAFVTQVLRREGSVLLLDRRCQDVLIARDLDQDGWPETLAATPHAASASWAYLTSVVALRSAPNGDFIASEFPLTPPRMRMDHNFLRRVPHRVYSDADGDGVVDTETIVDPDDPTPGVRGCLTDGDANVMVVGFQITTTKTAEVWALDASGAAVTLLGSASVAPQAEVLIPLSQALSTQDVVRISYEGEESAGRRILVRGAIPRLYRATPASLPSAASVPVSMEGDGLSATMALFVTRADGTKSTLAFTYVDSEHITATITTLTEDRFLMVWAIAPGQDIRVDGVHILTIRVDCE